MGFCRSIAGVACATILASTSVQAITIDTSDPASIKAAASTIAHGMMNYYNGNTTEGKIGLLPSPYYWWESGAMWGSLVDYWYYTGDTTYNNLTATGLLSQVGGDKNYMPVAQQKDEGNDDQGFWGLAAMSAAEANFPNPPSDQPQWLALAQGVFNSQALRWDNSTCGGGLRWQIFTFNSGYNYKNAISNGAFFNIAARLGHYTNNQTYYEWANKTFDWVEAVGLNLNYNFYDGSDDTLNCTDVNHIQWSYNAGIFLYGAAIMWNATGSPLWYERTLGIWNRTSQVFFTPTTINNVKVNPNVMYEVACEPLGTCNTDQQSFKAYLARWMAATTRVAPFMFDQINPYLLSTAEAVAAQCNGGDDGVTCGTKWYDGTWDGTWGAGQQMSALEAVQSTLITQVAGPLSNTTGGSSEGDVNAGTGGDSTAVDLGPVSTGDKAGAGILTALVLIGILGGAWWMIV